MVKIQFYDRDVGYENLWAASVNKERYRLENIPFFIYGVSLHDVVAASPDEEGRLQFQRVVKPSGNKTIRARSDEFVKDAAKRRKVKSDLRRLGSGVEELRSRLLAINVPPNVDLKSITDYLTKDAKVSWEYGNPEHLNKTSTE